MIKALTLTAVVFISGCALQQAPLTFEEMANQTPPKCQGAQHCLAMWQRAQTWVANNSRYKIQIATDAVIQTYSPTRNNIELAYSITRELTGPDSYSYTTRAGCDNVFGCRPTREKGLASLHIYLRATPK